MMRRQAGGVAGLLTLAALLVTPVLPGVMGGRVLAHAQLVAASPGPGEVLAEAPSDIRLVFSEELESEITSLDLVGPDDVAVLTGAGSIDPEDPFALVADLPALGDGVYAVRWRTLSAADGHVIEGSYSFGVGDPETLDGLGGGETEAPAADPPTLVGRFLVYIGFMGALGIAVFHAVVVRAGPMPRRLTLIVAAGLGLAAVASLILPVLDVGDEGSLGDTLLATRNGILALVRTGVAVIGAGVLLEAPARWRWPVAAATGATGLAVHVAAGHAAALPSPLGVAGQVVHVGAAGVWLGGIVALLVASIAPRLIVSDGSLPPMRTLVPRFSALALVAIGLVVLSGILAAWTLTGAVLDPGTTYGRTLLVKGVLVASALVLGGLNYLDGGRLRTWLVGMSVRLRVEVGLAALVLVVTAMLSTTPPRDDVAGVAIEPVPDAFGLLVPDVAIEVVPGRPGVNRLVVETTDALANASLSLAVEVSRLDVGQTTRIPLSPAVGEEAAGEGVARWTADAVVLPAGSAWDVSVLVIDDSEATLSRQRFSFTLDGEGVDDGRASAFPDPATALAAILAIGGLFAISMGIAEARLPRCEPRASRTALLIGGTVSAVLGAAIGVEQILRLVG